MLNHLGIERVGYQQPDGHDACSPRSPTEPCLIDGVIVEGELRIAVVVVGLPDAKDAAEHPQHTEDDAREHQEQHHAVPVVPCYLSMYADVLHD